MKDIPITNISFRARMKYFSDKKQKNLEKMIKAKKEEEAELAAEKAKSEETPRRRVQPAQTAPELPAGRRTSGSKYKVVSKAE